MRRGLTLWPPDASLSRVARAMNAAPRANAGTGLVTLPPWLVIACATASRSTRTSATAVVGSLGANAARARNVGQGWGLSVEQAVSSNVMPSPSDFTSANWAKQSGNTATADQAAAPDGTTTADLMTLTGAGAGFFPGAGTVVAATIYSASIWLRMVSGTGTVVIANAQATVGTPSFNLDTNWKLCDLAEAAPNTALGAPWVQKGASMSLYAWGAQYVTGKIPGSYMAGAASRAADVLSVPVPSQIAPAGWFDLDLIVAPNYTNAEQVADHDLVFFDANNRIYVQQSTSKVILRIGGANVLSSALTWTRDAPIRIRAQHRHGGRRLIVSGAATGNGDSGVQSAAAAISLPATAYVLGNASGAQESADLQRLAVFN